MIDRVKPGSSKSVYHLGTNFTLRKFNAAKSEESQDFVPSLSSSSLGTLQFRNHF